ncbi:ABC transporter permease [Paenibacillus apiarius]|uniref:ABC transporter permease n=1 Tax=Paenibacillus apiarius TaxID=46240 RepID=A0ABT4DUR2_9BACL|nr:ABC transporter permease [Paenibacillus apiarius]MCY9515274.1 ABC transporter permease [Paenibacillus apiarius]MCY9520023.1 ABC transporter permease [Paenibacillus apiarius]MCY9554354.1 ABC transporter permease [Paenibacillus apiarius]MCY9558145.1 ABC transporter permease [Paenibacillus apiarius]MCY9684940.1 ABC transporter permease [Paenibacillus apiarius]
MTSLIYSEFERLWQRKWVWLILLAIPVTSYSTASYFSWLNSMSSPDSMNYTPSSKLMFTGLNLFLPIICNFAVLPFVTTIFTEEFRRGQLRLLFLRQYSRGRIFISKMIVLCFTILLLLIVLGICLGIAGSIKLPSAVGITQGVYNPTITTDTIFQDTIKQYLLAYATLLGLCSIMSCIAMYCKDATYAIGIGFGYIIIPLMFERLIYDFGTGMPPLLNGIIALIFIPLMQRYGIQHALVGSNYVLVLLLIILLVHIVACVWLAYRRFVSEDYMH